ncbi:dual specificity protein phosphatase family protein [Poriferisphaera sp. WC338]|uniref:dual specificity protein phosphatase family protein n=1 Tax=Poriferisphaera sp. WC338 TaxID=3425129 RepID=UPI003D81C211
MQLLSNNDTRSQQSPRIWHRFLLATGLSIFFILIYGGCTAINEMRGDFGVIYFEWEQYIPFVPWLIIPYMSIDLFFFGAPFLQSNRDELRILRQRIMLGILIAGVCYILLPLQLVTDRPAVESGMLGYIFRFLHGFDKPYSNLLPSLHIILRCILVVWYIKRVKRIEGAMGIVLRNILHAWFFLIGCSTVLIGQHHIIDIIGGFIVAILVFYCVREPKLHIEQTTHVRIAVYYLAGVCICALLAFAGFLIDSILGWLLIGLSTWIGVALLIVVWGYMHAGYRVIAKSDGKIHLSSRLLLAPWLIGHYISLLYYKPRSKVWDVVDDHVWLGRCLNSSEAEYAVKNGVQAVVDMTCEFNEAKALRHCTYINLQTLDLTAPTTSTLDQAADCIMSQSKNGCVYVHCKIGYSRSAAVVAAYFLKAKKAQNVEEAVAMIREKRPNIIIRHEVMDALRAYKDALSHPPVRPAITSTGY